MMFITSKRGFCYLGFCYLGLEENEGCNNKELGKKIRRVRCFIGYLGVVWIIGSHFSGGWFFAVDYNLQVVVFVHVKSNTLLLHEI